MLNSLVVILGVASLFGLDFVEHQYTAEAKIVIGVLIIIVNLSQAGAIYANNMARKFIEQKLDIIYRDVAKLQEHNQALFKGYTDMKEQAEGLLEQNVRLLDELKKYSS